MARRVLLLTAVAVIVAATYWPIASFQFLNWDDTATIVSNSSLDLPRGATWAFTTTFMEHYQPLSWLMWAALKNRFGASAAAFHTANLVVHLIWASYGLRNLRAEQDAKSGAHSMGRYFDGALRHPNPRSRHRIWSAVPAAGEMAFEAVKQVGLPCPFEFTF